MSPLVQSTKELVAGLDLYPPVTLEELARAEERLPFPIPELLRELYTEVADGEIGPGGGLMGLMTSQAAEEFHDPTIVGTYLLWTADPDDAGVPWPRFYLPISYEGCQVYTCIDCSTPECAVICFDPSEDPEFGPASFHTVCRSLAAWWQAWIAEENQKRTTPRI